MIGSFGGRTRFRSAPHAVLWVGAVLMLYARFKGEHHWLMRGATFYQLHLLLDKHASEQLELVDMMAERVQMLGGVAVGDPRHVAEITSVPRAPNGAEEVPAMLSRLLEGARTDPHQFARCRG